MMIDSGRMNIYDISIPVTNSMPVYKGRESKRPLLTVDGDFATQSAYESRLEMNLHTGTHIDCPLHMIPGGTTVELLELPQVVTACKVFDFTNINIKITEDDFIGKDIGEDDFVLLKTRNSFQDILEGEYIYLEESGAKLLADRRVKGVGIDSLGIERNQPGHETHLRLLSQGIVILEGLNLKYVEEGEYLLSAAPILIEGVEAAPARAYLMK